MDLRRKIKRLFTMRYNFWNAIVLIVSKGGLDEWCPMQEETIFRWRDNPKDYKYKKGEPYKVVTFTDGLEVMFGWGDSWEYSMRKREFNKMVRNYIWMWIKDFFGLRSWLYRYASKQIRKRADKIRKSLDTNNIKNEQ